MYGQAERVVVGERGPSVVAAEQALGSGIEIEASWKSPQYCYSKIPDCVSTNTKKRNYKLSDTRLKDCSE